MNNHLKTVLFLSVLTGIFLFFGHLLGGKEGAFLALIFAGIGNFFAYWFSDKIVLAIYHAREVSEATHPRLYNIVRRLATKAGLPMPRVYVIPTLLPNAFATGRNPSHSAVAATEGILKILSDEELEGVIGHELAHIQNRDILISSVVATIAGAIAFLASMVRWAALFGMMGNRRDGERGGGGEVLAALVMAILAPIIATLIQLAISRSREYLADERGAKIAGNPLALASALKKLHSYAQNAELVPTPAQQVTSHLFIVNPFKGSSLLHLLSTHPPVEERIYRLEKMAGIRR